MKQIILFITAASTLLFNSCGQESHSRETTEAHPSKVLARLPDSTAGKWLVSLTEATEQLTNKQKIYDRFIQHGTMHVGLYQPKSEDGQKPHQQDEVYIIMQGTGTFRNGKEKKPFQPGDVLFVPAGVEHRFEDFSEDFLTWVVFYGPEGGEK